MFNEENDPYNHVPHQGKPFTEGGRTFYWNFSSAAVGTTCRAWQYGMLVGKIIPNQPVPATKKWYLTNITAVANGVFAGHRATKWECLEGHGKLVEQRGYIRKEKGFVPTHDVFLE